MKNILLPTDFSENAFNAALYSIDLYKDVPCNFILLHSFAIEEYYNGSVFVPMPNKRTFEIVKSESLKKLQDLKLKLERLVSGSNHRFETVMYNLPLEQAVNRELSKEKIEVIIIGTQGVTAARDVAYGNNTINLMENVINCPVLAVPSHVRFKKLKEIVLATGFKIEFHPGDLEYLLSLISLHHCFLRILHIEEGGLDTVQENNRNVLSHLLKPVEPSFHYLSYVSVPIGIYCFTESRGSDMIAFLNKKNSFFENLFFEPLYKRIGHFSQIPVLVMQINNGL